MASLKQIPEVQFVKIYDQFGYTREPAARVDSIPACLDPSFTPSVTPLPTSTLRSRFTPTPTRHYHIAFPLRRIGRHRNPVEYKISSCYNLLSDSYGYSSRDYCRDCIIGHRIVFYVSIRLSCVDVGAKTYLLPNQTPAGKSWTVHDLYCIIIFGICSRFVSLRRACRVSIFSSLPYDHAVTYHHSKSHDHTFAHDHAQPHHYQYAFYHGYGDDHAHSVHPACDRSSLRK